MKKLIKFVFWTLVVLLLLAVVLVATLPLWLGPVARPWSEVSREVKAVALIPTRLPVPGAFVSAG